MEFGIVWSLRNHQKIKLNLIMKKQNLPEFYKILNLTVWLTGPLGETKNNFPIFLNDWALKHLRAWVAVGFAKMLNDIEVNWLGADGGHPRVSTGVCSQDELFPCLFKWIFMHGGEESFRNCITWNAGAANCWVEKHFSFFFASPNKLSTVGTGNFHALPATTAIVECSVVSSTVPLWEEVSRWTLRVYVANKR